MVSRRRRVSGASITSTNVGVDIALGRQREAPEMLDTVGETRLAGQLQLEGGVSHNMAGLHADSMYDG